MTVNMDIKEIIEADIAKNHEGVSVEKAMELFERYLNSGYEAKQINDTVFIYKANKGTVKYHSINAASMKDYVANILEFFGTLQDYNVAVTPLTNPKLKGLIKRYLPKLVHIEGDYAITDLRSI